jgi:hypothetical protein
LGFRSGRAAQEAVCARIFFPIHASSRFTRRSTEVLTMRLKALRSILCIALSALLVAQSPEIAGASPGPANQSISIPKGTAIYVVTLEPVSSATAKKGQQVRMAVNQEVSVDGIIVIPVGTPVVGEVTHVRRAIPNKRDGHVRFEPVYLTLTNGTRLNLHQHPPGEGFGFWALFLIEWPVLAPVLRCSLGCDAGPDPTRQKIQVRGDDELRKACSWDIGYIAKSVRIPKIQSDPLAFRSPTFDSCVTQTHGTSK